MPVFGISHDRPVCGGHPGAPQSVDTGKVWIQTDDVSTCIRGRAEHVFDVTRAIFAYAAASGVHTVFNGTYSIGRPGDTDADVYMTEDSTRLNNDIGEHADMETACQFALTPWVRITIWRSSTLR